MKKYYLLVLIVLSVGKLWANHAIPDTIALGNVRVAIHPSAKPIFEKEFAMLGANKKYVESLVEKMRLYFPAIEPILAKGNIPPEFKFLCVQESALNANAISTSNAVGYWQFKLETAKDVGLQVDQDIDERRHIIESTKGAVNYFTRNNAVLNNWVGTLLSYRVGLGTVKKLPYATNWIGKTEIEVDSSTDWYVIRFLAYKEFWAEQMTNLPVQKDSPNLVTHINTQGKNLYDLSDELRLSYDDIKRYNAWILKDWIPADKHYTIYHPSNLKVFNPEELKQEEPILTASVDSTKLYAAPKSVKTKNKQILSDKFEIGSHTVVSGDNLSNIAAQYEMKLADLLRLNDLSITSVIAIGQKIKVNRRIPMLEIMAQKLEEKSAKTETKKPTTTPKEQDVKVEVEEVRKISSVEADKSFYIAPAESREIIIKSDSKEEKIIEQTQVNTPKETTPEVTPTPKPTGPVYYEHEVEAGETLFKIAKVYQVSVDDLIRWNNLGKSPKIRVGQKIKLKP